MKTVKLREVAHSRSGEKGRDSNITVIAYDEQDYALLRDQVTVDAVRSLYGPITKGRVTRYEAPGIGALNFVLEDVLEGGRSRTSAFDESGKALSSLMLRLDIQVPDDYVGRASRTVETLASEPVPTLPGKRVRLGSATAWSRDRFEPAQQLIEEGDIDYLCFDAMSEVTMSIAQMARVGNPDAPLFDPQLEERLHPLLRSAKERGVKLISNGGWLDPVGAAEAIARIAREQGVEIKVAAVTGSDLTDRVTQLNLRFTDSDEPVQNYANSIVSAEAYLGAQSIADALDQGADVVVTSRVADACLYLGPLVHEFGWSLDDHERMAKGMIVGHLAECGAQVCGGYFADPGYKDVPDLADIGHPIIDVGEDRFFITKVQGTGGLLSSATCKEQLLYEVQDPANYYCPDTVADLTKVRFHDIGKDLVEIIIDENCGKPKPPTLKALVGMREGFISEEFVLFAGPGALTRARATEALLRKRFEKIGLIAQEVRFDYVGINAVHREASPEPLAEPYEAVLRVVIRTLERKEAERLRREIDPLAVNGVSGTGKWGTGSAGSVRPVIGLNSTLVPREQLPATVTML